MRNKLIALLFLSSLIFPLNANAISTEAMTQTVTKGDRTYVTTKTIVNNQMTIVTKIYDTSGNLLDTQTVNRTLTTPPTKEMIYPTKTVTVKPSAIPSLPPIISPTPTTVPQNNFQLESNSPITVDPETGKISVQNGEEKKQFNVTPEQIMANAQKQGLTVIGQVKLNQQNQGKYTFQVTGEKQEKFLALIQVKLQTTLNYNPDTGSLENTDQSLSTKILDLLSF